jgi:hypothetical protein
MLNPRLTPGPVLILPPDLTRIHSRGGPLTGVVCRFLETQSRVGRRWSLGAIMPALGTHRPLSPEETARMFPDCPADKFLPHRWREDTVELGRLEADWVETAFCGQAAFRRITPIPVPGAALSKKEAETAYGQIKKRENKHTGKKTEFVRQAFLKMAGRRGFDSRVILVLGRAFEQAVHMYDEPVRAEHNLHTNLTGYSHYAARILLDNRKMYIRITLENLKTKKTRRGINGDNGKSRFHSLYLSYEAKNSAAPPHVNSGGIAPAAWDTGTAADIKLQQWLNTAKTLEGADSAFYLEWPVQVNRILLKAPPARPGQNRWDFSLIVSIGQVTPHEIAGMANHAKNIFVGTGGAGAIHKSHWLGALYGLERLMGVRENPVRALFDEALRRYGSLFPPILWILTVVDYHNQVRGLFCGADRKCFEDAADLAAQLNIERVSEYPGGIRKAVVWLDPEEYRSTWLGNKAVYRTRRALAAGGELLVLAPGLDCFGEDPLLDSLIRRWGYRGAEAIRRAVEAGGELAENLSAAAHLIHGSSEGRFTIRYCTDPSSGGPDRAGLLDRAAIEAVGYAWGDLEAARARYMPEGPDKQSQGWHTTAEGERYYFIRNPALGLWIA